MVKVAPSILSVNENDIEKVVIVLEKAGADYIHIDVMDGEFVCNETDGVTMIEKAHNVTLIPMDTHLMVDNPETFLEDFLPLSDIITFHIEAVSEEVARMLIDTIHSREVSVGIAIKPNTPVEEIVPYLDDIDLVLVMLVEPGLGGQVMIESCLDKVRVLRKMKPHLDIEVDGGINLENIDKVKSAGANIIVSGTAIINSKDKADTISKIKS